MATNEQPFIIKKVKKAAHGHHGGAWKIAYADFVTAMMAFFLLLWLISMTTPEQKKGLADYFAPPNVSESNSGAGGVMGGMAFTEAGAKIAADSTKDALTAPESSEEGRQCQRRRKGVAGQPRLELQSGIPRRGSVHPHRLAGEPGHHRDRRQPQGRGDRGRSQHPATRP
jgi:flagellar motor protein MotB